MKNAGEASVISRSQSETSLNNVQSKILNGTNKFDSLFPILDQISLTTNYPLFLYYLEALFLYYQVFFSSFFIFNNYWLFIYEFGNKTLIAILNYLEKIAWFFNIEYDNETNLLVAFLIVLIVFVISTLICLYVIFGKSKRHKMRKFLFYIIRFIVDIISPIMIIPASAMIGTSIRNIVLKNKIINILYLIIGIIVYIGFIFYSYIGFTILNSSICISKTLFSSNNIMIPLLLPTINSLFVIFQGIISLFEGWAMIIVQLVHIIIGIYVFHEIYYLLFHLPSANAIFIGVILSTWINDLIFTILYFIPNSKYKNNDTSFLMMAGLIIPLAGLVICIVLSSVFVYKKSKKILNQLFELSNMGIELISKEDFQLNSMPNVGLNLFQKENSALMAFHLSFINACPIFYNSTYLNHFCAQNPTTSVLLLIVQYLSFFPGESRELNAYLQIISKRNNLKYHQRFLIYQIIRFKMLRQSSVSTEANRRFAELKSDSQQCYENILSFYDNSNANVPFLEMIAKESAIVNMKWDETIREFPNNQKISDEYCTYLIECLMDLQKAFVMKYRANFIEVGKNFTVDIPFKCFAKCFPIYFKKRIVDFQGTFRHSNSLLSKNNKNSQTSSNQSNSSMRSGFSSTTFSAVEIDPELQDELGSQLFKKKNLRLEMHRALNNRKSNASLLILISAYVSLIIGLIFLIISYKYSTNYIDYRINSCDFINLVSKSISYLDLAMLGSTLKFTYYTNRFTTLNKFNDLDKEDDNYSYSNNIADLNQNIFRIDNDISYSVIHINRLKSMDYFHDLLDSLTDYANKNDESIYEFAYLLMANEVPYISCFDGFPLNEVNTSLKSLESYLFLVVEQSAFLDADETNWYSSNEVCEILSNQPGLHRNVLLLFASLMDHEIQISQNEYKKMIVMEIVFPVIIFLIDFVPIMIFMNLFFKDIDKMTHILLSVNQQSKEEAKMAIRKGNSIEYNQISEKKLSNKKWILIRILLFLISGVSAVIIFFILSETDKLNDEIGKMAKWDYFSSARFVTTAETINYILNAIILNGTTAINVSSSNKIANQEKMIELTKEGIKTLENSNNDLLKGTDTSAACYGFDNEIDSLNYMSVCEPEDENDLHDSYRCCSTSTSLYIFINMIENILTDIDSTNGNFNYELIPHLLHLFNKHLFSRLERFIARLNEVNYSKCQSLVNTTTIIFVIGIVITIFLFVAIYFVYIKSVSIYHVGMILTQRLPPHVFISDKKLLNFVLNKKDGHDENIMSTAQSAIFMSSNPIVCTNITGVVEIINPAVSRVLGYTPDQMLGQHISTIFSNFKNNISESPTKSLITNEDSDEKNMKEDKKQCSDAEKITNQIDLMFHGQSQLVYEDHFVCMTDDAKEMQCGVTILGMTSENDVENGDNKNVRIESFVIILRDETQLNQQQKDAEAAKARSENLLYHILPQDIVSRINSGEKDISFTVQSASIIFTDIVKFSEYATTLSPPEIMKSLSTLFEAFDEAAHKYSLITKIKLIGDIYMAAAGLFSDDIPPKNHANDIVKFGLDCLSELEEINMKLNASLQLRVGINSQGPILAGVLGTDKPVFDIIGDPINVAARLQTTDIPGKIQIPQSTYELIQDDGFSIEERGEVFLKGKGKTKTYLVSQFLNENTTLKSAEPLEH